MNRGHFLSHNYHFCFCILSRAHSPQRDELYRSSKFHSSDRIHAEKSNIDVLMVVKVIYVTAAAKSDHSSRNRLPSKF